MNASLGRTPISGAAHSISYDNLEDKNEVIAITSTFLLVRASVAPFLAPARGALAAFAAWRTTVHHSASKKRQGKSLSIMAGLTLMGIKAKLPREPFK